MPGSKRADRTAPLIAFVAVGGAVALGAAALAYPPTLQYASVLPGLRHHAGGPLLVLILVALTAAAELIAIRVRHGNSGELLTLFELAVVADIVLLPPSVAALVSVTGLAVALTVHRRPLVKFAFNLGQYALGVVPAVALYHGVGHGEFLTTHGLLALFAGMTAFTAINLLTISAIISATTRRPLRAVIAEEQRISMALGLGNSAVGMVAVSLYLTRPALLPAVLAPTLALHLAFKGWVHEKELSDRMEEEKTKLDRVLEHSSEGIVLADSDGTVILWSPAMEQVTGVPAAEAAGKALPYLLRGRGSHGEPVTVDVSESTEPFEVEIVAADGGARWLRVQHGPGFDSDGVLSFDVLVVTDVTRQLEVARLKDDFISTVSHELRTPLTPIKGYASLLLRRMDDIPDDRKREALRAIVERTDHMARLVEDLLLASRVSNSGERRLPEVNRAPVDVGHIATRAIRSFQAANPLREFVAEFDDESLALGDAIRVEQVVAHLVSNAVKFSDEGATVLVRVEQRPGDIAITVRDEGLGIPEDKYEEIFEKFKRLEDPLRMETGGAGLGLFIVRQLARAMGGDATVVSEIGRGSTFTVTLPVALGATPALPLRRSVDRAG